MPVARRLGFRTDAAEHIECAFCYTYAIWDGEYVKIGKSCSHPKRRMDTLQTGNPRQLSLLAYSATLSESDVHKRLSRWRVRGEWFSPSTEVLGYISAWCWVDVRLLAILQGECGVAELGVAD